MKELIKVDTNEQGAQLVRGRELHEFLESNERYSKWFERMAGYGFEYGVDFTSVPKSTVVNNGAERQLEDHALTIDMAKEVSMLQRNERGRQARKYFIECERRLKEVQVPQTYLETLKALVASEEEKQRLQAQNATMLPKAEFYDAVTGSDTVCDMATVAKVLDMGIGRNKLFALLRRENILQADNKPYQNAVNQGWFRIVESRYTLPNGDEQVYFKTVVTQKGVDYIRKLINH